MGDAVDINILCRLFQHRCRRRAAFAGLKIAIAAVESVVFCCFRAAPHPRIATSTVDKKTDGDIHY